MTRPLVINGNVATLVLSKGYRAIIDSVDAPMVVGRDWSALVLRDGKAVYAVRVEQVAGKQKMILLHRFLMNAPDSMHVDHKDGDGLNCRRENMRLCTQAENNLNKGMRSDNKSGLKGVSWEARAGKWKSEISRGGERRFIGYFRTREDAHEAYAKVAKEFHGQFARLK